MLTNSDEFSVDESDSEDYDLVEEAVPKGKKSEAQQALEELVRREAIAVHVWRAIVFSCMAAAAAVVSRGVYVYLRNVQTRDFETGFRLNARELIDNFNREAGDKLQVLNPLATAFTSYALSRNLTFPFVTLPDFAYRASNAQILSNLVQIRYLPILYTDEIRLQWEEEFALEHYNQIMDSWEVEIMNIAKQDALYHPDAPPLVLDDDDGGNAWGDDDDGGTSEWGDDDDGGTSEWGEGDDGGTSEWGEGDDGGAEENAWEGRDRDLQWNQGDDAVQQERAWDGLKELSNSTLPFQLDDGYYTRIRDDELLIEYGTEPYLPLWQVSHVTQVGLGNLNDDFGSSFIFGSLYQKLLKDPRAALGPISVAGPWIYDRLQKNLRASQYRHELEEYIQQPTAFLAVPVFDGFDENKSLAGVLATNIYWRVNFINVLPPDAIGYTCVLNNSFGQTATFRIDGPLNVTFLSRDEDLHDPAYDDQVVYANMNKFITEKDSIRTRAYTSTPMDDQFGVYELFIYPSNVTESTYRDNSPAVNAGAVAVIFFATIVAFFLYDRMIERTQSLIMERAIKSSEIVENLFPKQVQERMYGHMDNSAPRHSRIRTAIKSIAQRRNSMTHYEDEADVSVASHNSSTAPGGVSTLGGSTLKSTSAPIVDAFPATTILFADLPGFNDWTSKHQPNDVFEFLEDLFRSLDMLAKRYAIFKVETVGDCYLAATGVPEPQDDHAVRMVRFAKSCLVKASQVISVYEFDDNLRIRIGVHSGPITAGILRGQKSRFQIFGDTVNTASRMESTGMPGRIQISETTMAELVKAGHPDWVTLREDQVFAKGKGYLTTYWVRPSIMKSRSAGTTSTDRLFIQEKIEDPGAPAAAQGLVASPPGGLGNNLSLERLRLMNTNSNDYAAASTAAVDQATDVIAPNSTREFSHESLTRMVDQQKTDDDTGSTHIDVSTDVSPHQLSDASENSISQSVQSLEIEV